MDCKVDWNEINIGQMKVIKYICQEDVYLTLLKGTLEHYGAEIPIFKGLNFKKDDYGVLWTYHGCSIQFKGKFVYYISSFMEEDSVPNISFNIHTCLDYMRKQSSKLTLGPKVMVCGGNGFGKNQFCRTLVNYKIRDMKEIMYIDAELNNSDLGIPGSMSAMVVSHPYEIHEGWDVTDDIITFNFGHPSGTDDSELFILQLNELSKLVNQKLSNNSDLLKNGFILNMDSLDNGDYCILAKEKRATIIKRCITDLKIDYVFVIDDGFLEQMIRTDLHRKAIIIRIPMPIQKINTYESESALQARLLSSYFTGQGSTKIQLRTFKIFPNKFKIYRIDPPTSENQNRLTQPTEMKMSRFFLYSYLAISQAKEPQDISKMPIYGYIMVIEALHGDGLKIITPGAAKLPSYILIFNGIKSEKFA